MTGPRLDPVLSVGERIAAWRRYRGLTQEACAGLVGKSLSWWKKVEHGTRHVERLADLLLVAQVLRVRELSELTGGPQIALALDRTREHPLLPDMRQAMLDAVDPRSTDPASPDADSPVLGLPELRQDLTEAWARWHNSARHVTVTGRILPALLRATAVAHTRAGSGDQRRQAARLLSEIYLLACYWLQYTSQFDLGWIAADRAMLAARESRDTVAVALASWTSSIALKDLGRAEEALECARRGASLLEPHLADGPTDYRSVWGHLHLQAALTAAHCADEGGALRHWDAAEEMSRRLGPDHAHPITVFGQPNVGRFAVMVNVALGRPAAALAAADRLDMSTVPSAALRSRGWIDVARGYAGRRDDVACLHVLQRAEQESPDAVAHSVLVHEMVREMLRRDRRTIMGELHEFAQRTGILATG